MSYPRESRNAVIWVVRKKKLTSWALLSYLVYKIQMYPVLKKKVLLVSPSRVNILNYFIPQHLFVWSFVSKIHRCNTIQQIVPWDNKPHLDKLLSMATDIRYLLRVSKLYMATRKRVIIFHPSLVFYSQTEIIILLSLLFNTFLKCLFHSCESTPKYSSIQELLFYSKQRVCLGAVTILTVAIPTNCWNNRMAFPNSKKQCQQRGKTLNILSLSFLPFSYPLHRLKFCYGEARQRNGLQNRTDNFRQYARFDEPIHLICNCKMSGICIFLA